MIIMGVTHLLLLLLLLRLIMNSISQTYHHLPIYHSLAPRLYGQMLRLKYVDPLLLYHGRVDNNRGTAFWSSWEFEWQLSPWLSFLTGDSSWCLRKGFQWSRDQRRFCLPRTPLQFQGVILYWNYLFGEWTVSPYVRAPYSPTRWCVLDILPSI